MTLKELCKKNNYTTDKESSHQYLCVYEELFAPLKDKKINLFECGYATGGSIHLWEDYFPNAYIYCTDINPPEDWYDNHGTRVILLDEDINKIPVECVEGMDIAIDDGSHLVEDQIAFVKLIWPVLNKGGIMIIEDVFDIDNARKQFEALNIPFYIVDLRCLNNRWDNVLIIYRKW